MTDIPTWEGFLRPTLEALSDGDARSRRAVYSEVADRVGLNEAQRTETMNSGGVRYENRIGWALSFLARAEAVQRPKRGTYVITDGGRTLLASNPSRISEEDLAAIPAYAAYEPKVRNKTIDAGPQTPPLESPLDPVEQIEQGVARIHSTVAADLLKRLRSETPEFLEQAVLDLLVAMGYGGVAQRARRIGGTGDGGVDGVIDQDALGLSRIYVQAKRYAAENTIGRPQIQGFVGALHGHQASQGVFITTSSFSREADEYAGSVNASVVLIDGQRLAELMIAYAIGVQTVQTYRIVELDEDYFE